MMNLSLGTIEVCGLPAALEAADVACKTADVKLIGYEATDGLGMVAVKIEGNVSAVQSAIAAARAAAGRITTVFATSVIARPNPQIEPVVDTDVTVGRGAATSATPLESKPRPRRKRPNRLRRLPSPPSMLCLQRPNRSHRNPRRPRPPPTRTRASPRRLLHRRVRPVPVSAPSPATPRNNTH